MSAGAPAVPFPAPTRRRRRPPARGRGPVAARLLLDPSLRGDDGVVSEDLVAQLFPRRREGRKNTKDEPGPKVCFVALAPFTSRALPIDDLNWTTVPVRLAGNDGYGGADGVTASPNNTLQGTVQLPAASAVARPVVDALAAGAGVLPGRPVEVLLLDVVPLPLDAIYVSVDRGAVADLDDAHSRFGGGSGSDRSATIANGIRPKPKPTPAEREARLVAVVREALAGPRVVHSGDVLPLPLPAHPISHVPPPPVTVAFCEPISQGRLLPRTRVVLVPTKGRRGHRGQQRRRQLVAATATATTSGMLPEVAEHHEHEAAEDTANEQFFSAAEDRPPRPEATDDDNDDTDATAGASSSLGSADSEDDHSDSSADDLISLSTPDLPGPSASTAGATPRPGSSSRFDAPTPGSVLSSFTATTARGAGGRRAIGKVFATRALLERVPPDMLHPRPRADDDTEAAVYVDIHMLVRIGCFSGDWVRVEGIDAAAAAGQSRPIDAALFTKLGSLGATNGSVIGSQQQETPDFRIVRVHGLAGLSPPKPPRYAINSSSRRPSWAAAASAVTAAASATPTVLVSPLLLANMNSPGHLRLSPVPRPGPAASGSMAPPAAKEVTLAKIATPLSLDRGLQPALFAGLKRYFESQRRLVKAGDLVGISVDTGLGRTMFGQTGAAGGSTDDDFAQLGFSPDAATTTTTPTAASASDKVGVAWFRVSQLSSEPGESDGDDLADRWGGVAAIDPASTRMSTAAAGETATVPGTLAGGAWLYWLGVRPAPRLALPKGSSSSSGPNPSRWRPLTDADLPRPYIPAAQRRVRELAAAATNPRALRLGMRPVVVLLTSTQRRIGKATAAERACADLGLHPFSIDAYDILSEGGGGGGGAGANGSGSGGGDVKTEAYLKARAERALACGPSNTALLVRHVDALSADRMVAALEEIVDPEKNGARVVIMTTTEVDRVPDRLRALATHELAVAAPERAERAGILGNVVTERGVKVAAGTDLGAVAVKTAALVAGDLVDVVDRAEAARALRLRKLAEAAAATGDTEPDSPVPDVRDVEAAGGDAISGLTDADFEAAVEAARKNFADAIGAPKIPNVSWADVGGLAGVKEAVMETIALPLDRPELFARGMKKRSGMLFYGPPGTGKTLLAKAIATEFSLNFFSVKGPELLNMYIGESEANVRRVFQRARDARPCVVFFDELDSVAPKRGNQGDSGGVMDRIVSQLLAELDGMSGGGGAPSPESSESHDPSSSESPSSPGSAASASGVFVVGATNRPDLLDPALLRPGRFDKLIYLGLPDTPTKQRPILDALTRRFALAPGLDMGHIAASLPKTLTGADLYALCADAMLKAITRRAAGVEEKVGRLRAEEEAEREQKGLGAPQGHGLTTAYFFDHIATPEDVAVMVTEEDFAEANAELVSSVSAKELEHFERIRRAFESDVDRAKPPGGGAPPDDATVQAERAGISAAELATAEIATVRASTPTVNGGGSGDVTDHVPSTPGGSSTAGSVRSRRSKGRGRSRQIISGEFASASLQSAGGEAEAGVEADVEGDVDGSGGGAGEDRKGKGRVT